jgi:methionyl aminopeptidase
VKDYVGHGIGTQPHEEPPIPHYVTRDKGARLKEGMVICIEPMINMGSDEVRLLDDGWTVVTVDGSLSAHFEHTVAITKDGPRVLSA